MRKEERKNKEMEAETNKDKRFTRPFRSERFRVPKVILDREGNDGLNDFHTNLGYISTQAPSPSQPVLPSEHEGCSPRSQI